MRRSSLSNADAFPGRFVSQIRRSGFAVRKLLQAIVGNARVIEYVALGLVLIALALRAAPAQAYGCCSGGCGACSSTFGCGGPSFGCASCGFPSYSWLGYGFPNYTWASYELPIFAPNYGCASCGLPSCGYAPTACSTCAAPAFACSSCGGSPCGCDTCSSCPSMGCSSCPSSGCPSCGGTMMPGQTAPPPAPGSEFRPAPAVPGAPPPPAKTTG